MTNLVYIHIGNEIPHCLYDSIYQSILIHEYNIKIFVIINDDQVALFNKKIFDFNLNVYSKKNFNFCSLIQAIPLSILDKSLEGNKNFNDYKETISTRFKNMSAFRNGFWISTTARFYYIENLMKILHLKDVFHIENDVMLYETIDNLYNYILKIHNIEKIDKICMVEDSYNRVIPSILFFPNNNLLSELTQYITTTISNSNQFINDMNILGTFPNKYCLPSFPEKNKSIVFDGAAIGQYLGGVDYRNLPNANDPLVKYNNPSIGFINETSDLNCSEYTFLKTRVILDYLNVPIKVNMMNHFDFHQIANLHIHSKQLYQFSSIFDIKFDDIITGDRITSLADFVLTTPEIYHFHKNLDKYNKEIIIIKDFDNINFKLLNTYFLEHCKKNNTNIVKLFIYTHILNPFIKNVLPFLNRSSFVDDKPIKYVLYIHNSDHAFTNEHVQLLYTDNIKKIYCQNIDINLQNVSEKIKDKLTLLPIGIANSMWTHGNLLELYSVMAETYKIKKKNNIYVNINPNTFYYRKILLDKINEKNNFKLSSGKPYIDYLKELSSHYFCLCLRGNGIDTHRFWESLYLGVIPVIINNNETKSVNFIEYLKRLKVPFYEIKNEDLDIMFTKYTNEFFNESLYKSIIKNCGDSIYNIDSLKLDFYEYNEEN